MWDDADEQFLVGLEASTGLAGEPPLRLRSRHPHERRYPDRQRNCWSAS
jgi:hypothetical protein